MTIKFITFRNLVVAGMLCFVAVSCSEDDDADNHLPAGTYPMTFTTAVDGLTAPRATTDNMWEGTEEVAIQIGNEVKKYKAASSGSLDHSRQRCPFLLAKYGRHYRQCLVSL